MEAPALSRSRSEEVIRATITRTPSASSLLRARRASVSIVVLYCANQICNNTRIRANNDFTKHVSMQTPLNTAPVNQDLRGAQRSRGQWSTLRSGDLAIEILAVEPSSDVTGSHAPPLASVPRRRRGQSAVGISGGTHHPLPQGAREGLQDSPHLKQALAASPLRAAMARKLRRRGRRSPNCVSDKLGLFTRRGEEGACAVMNCYGPVMAPPGAGLGRIALGRGFDCISDSDFEDWSSSRLSGESTMAEVAVILTVEVAKGECKKQVMNPRSLGALTTWGGIQQYTHIYSRTAHAVTGMCPMRFLGVSMEQRRNERTGEMGDTRENPPSNGIVRHYSHIRKSGSDPGCVFEYGAALSPAEGISNCSVRRHRVCRDENEMARRATLTNPAGQQKWCGRENLKLDHFPPACPNMAGERLYPWIIPSFYMALRLAVMWRHVNDTTCVEDWVGGPQSLPATLLPGNTLPTEVGHAPLSPDKTQTVIGSEREGWTTASSTSALPPPPNDKPSRGRVEQLRARGQVKRRTHFLPPFCAVATPMPILYNSATYKLAVYHDTLFMSEASETIELLGTYVHYLPESNWAPVHNVCSVVVIPLESRRANSCGYNSSHPVWHALYECLHGDPSPFLLQPFHELSNGIWRRLASPHAAIQFVPKMFYMVEVGALGGLVQSANIVVGLALYTPAEAVPLVDATPIHVHWSRNNVNLEPSLHRTDFHCSSVQLRWSKHRLESSSFIACRAYVQLLFQNIQVGGPLHAVLRFLSVKIGGRPERAALAQRPSTFHLRRAIATFDLGPFTFCAIARIDSSPQSRPYRSPIAVYLTRLIFVCPRQTNSLEVELYQSFRKVSSNRVFHVHSERGVDVNKGTSYNWGSTRLHTEPTAIRRLHTYITAVYINSNAINMLTILSYETLHFGYRRNFHREALADWRKLHRHVTAFNSIELMELTSGHATYTKARVRS
ncbi:hypothetical protein PR048_018367 [Dryococelus australis]|uniref:Uncharacterized protein n=1 Tax=Dryococelus australis TaxID=614101 RepID=A0ABQ9HC34_9NEOP|nr:hypothetical protein PR048_018367 [Dryococelus australis]